MSRFASEEYSGYTQCHIFLVQAWHCLTLWKFLLLLLLLLLHFLKNIINSDNIPEDTTAAIFKANF